MRKLSNADGWKKDHIEFWKWLDFSGETDRQTLTQVQSDLQPACRSLDRTGDHLAPCRILVTWCELSLSMKLRSRDVKSSRCKLFDSLRASCSCSPFQKYYQCPSAAKLPMKSTDRSHFLVFNAHMWWLTRKHTIKIVVLFLCFLLLHWQPFITTASNSKLSLMSAYLQKARRCTMPKPMITGNGTNKWCHSICFVDVSLHWKIFLVSGLSCIVLSLTPESCFEHIAYFKSQLKSCWHESMPVVCRLHSACINASLIWLKSYILWRC